MQSRNNNETALQNQKAQELLTGPAPMAAPHLEEQALFANGIGPKQEECPWVEGFCLQMYTAGMSPEVNRSFKYALS